VPLDAWLPDAELLAIANENNLSETAFFVPNGENYDLRWFTPTVEVDLCGHATLATAFVLREELAVDRSELRFDTRSGRLIVRVEEDRLAMEFPRWDVEPVARIPDAWTRVVGALPELLYSTSQGEELFAVYANEEQIVEIQPEFDSFDSLGVGAVIVTAPGRKSDCVCRFFAPGYGVPEDPGTGSIHCALAPYWSERLDKPRIASRQLSRRGAEFDCELRADVVIIRGTAVRYLAGTIEI
jgi:PhzF family phenazine biosynthesis protein